MNHREDAKAWLSDAEQYFQDGHVKHGQRAIVTVLLSIAHSLARIADNLISSPEDRP